MTKEEILGMEAGADLDELVAQTVMGMRFEIKQPYLGWPERKFWFDEYNRIAKLEHYSTDISIAWPVVVKMGLGLFPLNNKDWCCCKASHIYHVEIGQDHYYDPNLVICKEAPEAICKAALLIKLENNEVKE